MSFLGESARFIHVVFGAIGLVAFWVPIFARKGGVNHVRFGKIFVWSAYILLAAAAISLTGRFVGIAMNGGGPSVNPAMFSFLIFLAYLTFVTLVIVKHGMAVLKYKKNHTALRSGLNFTLAYAAIVASAALVFYALVLSPPTKILLLALSPIGFGSGYGILQFIKSESPSPRGWMYEHLGAMLGSGIAFHTAFAVFGSTRLFDIGLEGWVAVIPWVVPTAVGIPAITIWTRYYRRKFREIT